MNSSLRASPRSFNRLLSIGSRGQDVSRVQDALRKAGFNPGATDGIFGRQTAAAVRHLQSAKHLKTDGIVGRDTTARLNLADSFEPAAHAHPPSTTTHATASRATGGRVTVPAELRRFGNGRIPSSQLTSIGIGGHRLYAPAAQAFKQMRAAAAREGINIGVTDSYRSYATQVDLVRRKGLYSQGGLAATPGTSNHGWGMALDVDTTSRGTQWLRANAGKFGFATIPREPWHWEYRR